MAKFRATRKGRYGAIRGVSGKRYYFNDDLREIEVTDEGDIAYFKRNEAFEHVEPPKPKLKPKEDTEKL